MEGFTYPYVSPYTSMQPQTGDYPDHGDGFGEFFELGNMKERGGRRSDRQKYRSHRHHSRKRSQSRSTNTNSRSPSPSKSRSRSRSKTRSPSHPSPRELVYKEPSFLDAFRVLYLRPSKHHKNSKKFLQTKKRQDKVHEILKKDGLGSKRWLFYPWNENQDDPVTAPVIRDHCDQRVKIDGDFFRKYKKRNMVDSDAPIAKLKRWELIFYKKLGFIQAV